jgi:mono/diheme cytochrome c family protein
MKRAAILGVAVLGLALACGGNEDGESTGTAPAEKSPAPAAKPAAPAGGGETATARAEQIFSTRCATCHGAGGAGDGPGSKGLNPPPRDFRDAEWQASVSDDHLKKIIQYGGAAVGRSPAMPGNPDLISKPEVVEALVRHIRSLGGT